LNRGRVTSARRGGDGVLWAISNNPDGALAVIGYSLDLLGRANYSGAPTVQFALDYDSVGHGLCLLADGNMVAAISEYDESGNGAESWIAIPTPNRQRGYVSHEYTSGLNLIRVDSLTNWPDTNAYGARDAAQLPSGEVVLSRGFHATVTLDQLYGVADHSDAPCTSFSTALLGWDTHVNGTDFWAVNDGDAIASIASSGLLSGGTQTVNHLAQGANVGAGSPNGIGGFAFDASGGCWRVNYADSVLRYYDATVMGALTGSATNPANTRTLTSTAFGGNLVAYDIAIDADDGAWVLTYEEPSRLLYFGAAKLAAGGAQDPDREIVLPISYAVSPRFSPGYGVPR
jgi:hypothetical protein